MSDHQQLAIKICKPKIKRTSLSLTEKEVEMFEQRAYELGFTGIQQYLVYIARMDCAKESN